MMKSLYIHFNINTQLPFNIRFSRDFRTTIVQRTTTIVLLKIQMLLATLFSIPIQDKHWYNNKKSRSNCYANWSAITYAICNVSLPYRNPLRLEVRFFTYCILPSKCTQAAWKDI